MCEKTRIVMVLLLGYSLLLVMKQYGYFCWFWDNYKAAVWDFELSDWLINYQAGFVRRGLAGQILYWLYDVFGMDPMRLVVGGTAVALLVFTFLFVRKWIQYQLSVLLLPICFLIGGYWGSITSFTFYRRDVLIFLLAWCIFYSYGKAMKGRRLYYSVFVVTSIIVILLHEGAFFYIIPLVGTHFFLYKLRQSSWVSSLQKSIVLLLPAIVTFLLCSYYKGNVVVANEIWNSWQPLFSSWGEPCLPMGKGVKALSWTTKEAVDLHIGMNFFHCNYYGIPNACFWPFVFFVVIFLLVNINKCKVGIKSTSRPFYIVKYMHILIWQFVFMLPLFTVLSCDYGRLFLYWILSSFLFYFSVSEKMLSVFYSPKLSWRVKRVCLYLSTGFWGKKYVFVIAFLFTGMSPVGVCVFNFCVTSIAGTTLSMVFVGVKKLIGIE